GPGFRPNATIARAIGLIVRNAFGIRPHLLEQATQGLPGRWSICFGENEEESPWEPLAQVGGLAAGADAVSATLLRTCEFVDNRHTHDAEQLLWDFADTIARPGSLIFRDTAIGVVFCPEHAQMLAEAGFSRSGVQRWLIEHAGRTQADLWRAGKGLVENRVRSAGGTAPGEEGADELVRVLPDDVRAVLVAVAGARNAGISMVVRQFGLWSGRSVPIEKEAAAGEASLAPTKGDWNDQ
ncbi:MAG: hypothetical protein J2P45_22070, partial [Candidatus Dormibacteraeota bacterium]|nr:hypothetical protein [Candidatus Dormibacteraeota bacterium]